MLREERGMARADAVQDERVVKTRELWLMRLETGERSWFLPSLWRLCLVLRVTPQDILTWVDEFPPQRVLPKIAPDALDLEVRCALRERRLKLGRSLPAVAAAMGSHMSRVSEYESARTRRPALNFVVAYARALDLSFPPFLLEVSKCQNPTPSP